MKVAQALGGEQFAQLPLRFAGRRRLRVAGALAVLVTAGLLSLQAADPPHLIPFQGHLARPSTADPTQYEPVPAARYDILFTLYAAPVGGESKVWGPERHAQVTVVNGLVNAILGSVIGFQDAIAANPNFFARPLYVGITIDADGNPNTADLELVPRQALLPAVYALGALRADRLDGKDWRDFFVGTDDSGTFTSGVTKARDAEKLDGYDWGNVFQNGDPTSTVLSARIADRSITAQKIAPQTLTAAELAPATITSQQIAPHTITEANLHTSLTMNSIIPPGTISAFAGSEANIPVGWLLCDGRTLRTNDAPGLFAAIGTSWGSGRLEGDEFKVPDLRGMFLRGVTGARTDAFADPDVAARLPSGGNAQNDVGSAQANALATHAHIWGQTTSEADAWDRALQSWTSPTATSETSVLANVWPVNAAQDEWNTVAVGVRYFTAGKNLTLYTKPGSTIASSGEARPNNAYVNYIIKL